MKPNKFHVEQQAGIVKTVVTSMGEEGIVGAAMICILDDSLTWKHIVRLSKAVGAERTQFCKIMHEPLSGRRKAWHSGRTVRELRQRSFPREIAVRFCAISINLMHMHRYTDMPERLSPVFSSNQIQTPKPLFLFSAHQLNNLPIQMYLRLISGCCANSSHLTIEIEM